MYAVKQYLATSMKTKDLASDLQHTGSTIQTCNGVLLYLFAIAFRTG